MLDERKQAILRAIVRDYIETAEPVGSEVLSQRHPFGVKPATLRNEMAEMAEMGYLEQPHTSAGRVPSVKGYRYYVDWLITPRELSPTERHRLRTRIERLRAEVDRILHETCRILSALTSYVSMATPPEMEQDAVRQVHLAALDRHRLLVVLALETGRVEHAVTHVEADLLGVNVRGIEYQLDSALQGLTVAQAHDALAVVPDRGTADGAAVYRAVVAAVRDTLARIRAEESGEVFIEGTAQVLHQPEFRNASNIRGLMELLEERRRLFSLLRELYSRQSSVVIGSESNDPAMHICSLVAARYTVMGRFGGSIGVLGPMRMDYDRAVPAVRFMARSLGEVLTKLSL